MTSKKQCKIAIDFAVLVLSMSTADFLPDISVHPDMSDLENSASLDWERAWVERTDHLVEKSIKAHPLGQHLLETGYSWRDIYMFIINVQARELESAMGMLLQDPE